MSNESQTIQGGQTVEVVIGGKTQSILIRELTVAHLARGSEILMSEELLIAETTGQSKEWIHALPMRTFNELAKFARKVNADFFESVDRNLRNINTVIPGGLTNLLVSKVQEASQTPSRRSLYPVSPGTASQG